jgi:hypothetical protein
MAAVRFKVQGDDVLMPRYMYSLPYPASPWISEFMPLGTYDFQDPGILASCSVLRPKVLPSFEPHLIWRCDIWYSYSNVQIVT